MQTTIIRNGLYFDGTGAPGQKKDVIIKNNFSYLFVYFMSIIIISLACDWLNNIDILSYNKSIF